MRRDKYIMARCINRGAAALAMALVFAACAKAQVTSDLQSAVDDPYNKYKVLKKGENAAAKINHAFSIQSVARPFTAARTTQRQGLAAMRNKNRVHLNKAANSVRVLKAFTHISRSRARPV